MRAMRWMWLAVAVVVGLGGRGAWAQAAAKATTFSGDVTSVGADSFVIADKNGTAVTVPVGAGTAYQFDKNNATYQEAVQVGLPVKGNLGADGVAATVSSKPAKAAKAANAAQPSKADQLQAVLQASDAEWLLLRPLIEKVQGLQSQVSALDKTASVKTIQPVTASNEAIKSELAARRDARKKVEEELATAQAQLIKVLTLRQEILLLELGIVK